MANFGTMHVVPSLESSTMSESMSPVAAASNVVTVDGIEYRYSDVPLARLAGWLVAKKIDQATFAAIQESRKKPATVVTSAASSMTAEQFVTLSKIGQDDVIKRTFALCAIDDEGNYHPIGCELEFEPRVNSKGGCGYFFRGNGAIPLGGHNVPVSVQGNAFTRIKKTDESKALGAALAQVRELQAAERKASKADEAETMDD